MAPPTYAPGAPCWIDLSTADLDRATTFYCTLFGWTAESAGPEYGGYVILSKDGQRVGGAMTKDPEGGFPDVWSVYLTTTDAKATADAAVDHGGEVVLPPMEVGPLGTMAFVTDAGQAHVGMWQPGEHLGFDILGEPGTPNWFELHTRAYEATVAFYRDVFGWDTYAMSDTPEFRYTTLGQGDEQKAGIMDASAFLPEGVPAHWSVYFGTPDTDAALAQIVELGGAVLLPAEDTPYGRIAAATDPTGAMFKLVG